MTEVNRKMQRQPAEARFEVFRQRMEAAGLPPLAVEAFRHYYDRLLCGETGLIHERDLEPVDSLPDAGELAGYEPAGREALAHTAILKLNGGLGTSMGLDRAKSLLPAKNSLTFLDIIARQALSLRETIGRPVPLMLMNSFSTHRDTLEALEQYPELRTGIPIAFVQNRVPKVLQEGLQPAVAAGDEDVTWCPPGHGDLYIALQTSGILDTLRAHGTEYLFVSNSDNLGAVLDLAILGYFVREELPFLMEVADRTESDRKGGHLARRRSGHLLLREVAQCPQECEAEFTDIGRHRYFNTNNIWLHLPSLRHALEAGGGVLRLPLIRNSKTLDPRDPASPPVYQLETAMGSAIELFEGAGAVRVPRTRFAPVKLSSDLLALWSDAYRLSPDYRLMPNPENRYGSPAVKLDPHHYKFVDMLLERFPEGAPSLSGCRSFSVEGDVSFGKNVTAEDDVRVIRKGPGPGRVAEGAILRGEVVV